MEKYKLIHKSKEEIILDIKNTVDGLKILLEDTSEKLNVKTGSQLIKKNISFLNDQIKNVDDFGGYYLVDKEDNKIIEIDFGKKFITNKIEEINSEYYHLIEVSYTDYKNNKCICLYDFNGKLLIERCLEYEFVGKEIKVLQYGYMINKNYELSDERYWLVIGSDCIIGRYSIEYDKDLRLYIVDDINCYSEQLEFIGKKDKYPFNLTSTHLCGSKV
jgi:hypothetical protein